jgi:hypothetical protein
VADGQVARRTLAPPQPVCENRPMADEHEDPITLRGLDGKIDRILAELVELKTRLGRLELNVGQVQVTLAEHSIRIDGIATRLDRIERRLDLVDRAVPGYPGCP